MSQPNATPPIATDWLSMTVQLPAFRCAEDGSKVHIISLHDDVRYDVVWDTTTTSPQDVDERFVLTLKRGVKYQAKGLISSTPATCPPQEHPQKDGRCLHHAYFTNQQPMQITFAVNALRPSFVPPPLPPRHFRLGTAVKRRASDVESEYEIMFRAMQNMSAADKIEDEIEARGLTDQWAMISRAIKRPRLRAARNNTQHSNALDFEAKEEGQRGDDRNDDSKPEGADDNVKQDQDPSKEKGDPLQALLQYHRRCLPRCPRRCIHFLRHSPPCCHPRCLCHGPRYPRRPRPRPRPLHRYQCLHRRPLHRRRHSPSPFRHHPHHVDSEEDGEGDNEAANKHSDEHSEHSDDDSDERSEHSEEDGDEHSEHSEEDDDGWSGHNETDSEECSTLTGEYSDEERDEYSDSDEFIEYNTPGYGYFYRDFLYSRPGYGQSTSRGHGGHLKHAYYHNRDVYKYQPREHRQKEEYGELWELSYSDEYTDMEAEDDSEERHGAVTEESGEDEDSEDTVGDTLHDTTDSESYETPGTFSNGRQSPYSIYSISSTSSTPVAPPPPSPSYSPRTEYE
ncbi:MAG: hypothetical protein J3Q66DRAFT_423409 [Benniella sp.]|nr:MAG: hypothetical protein J3Q66DRAFT_423409 [Benniella sp.]